MPFDGTKIQTVAARMREIFGPDGKNWRKDTLSDSSGRSCLVGALDRALNGECRIQIHTDYTINSKTIMLKLRDTPAFRMLVKSIGIVSRESYHFTPMGFNDRSGTTFKDIQNILDKMEELETIAIIGQD